MIKSGVDLLKYITQSTLKYYETPKHIRKQYKLKQKPPWKYHWFGMVPMALQMWMRNNREQK